MFSKPLIRTVAAAFIVAACAVVASAQMTQVTGKVTLKQADGTQVPVSGAVIDIYRTDISQKFQIKTDKKGNFIHAGLPFIGTYTLAVSAPGARPTFASGLRFTQTQTQDFTLEPGDGSKLTLEQIKQLEAGGGGGGGASGGSGGRESAESKAEREERERKIKEIEAKNAEITKSNEVITRTFKAGNDALTAGRVEEAITQYREGLTARPDEPALLTNLAEALRRRADDRYNASIQIKDANDPNRTQGVEAAKKDWAESAALAQKAIDSATANLVGADPQQTQTYSKNKVFAQRARAFALRRVATKVDPTQAQAAWTAYADYIAVEADPAAKAKYRAEALQMLFDAGATDLAVAEARKVLAENPDDLDANRIIGLALFASGNQGQYQEAANFLQRYVDKAPDTDPLKQSARESLEYLKTSENVKPEKAQPTRPVRRRP